MALIHCPECGKEISDTAQFCVNCGFTIQKYLARQAARQAEAQRKAAQAEREAQKQAARAEKTALREAARAEQEAQIQAAVPAADMGPMQSNRKKRFIIGGAIALVAIVAVVLILVLSPKDSEAPSEPTATIPKFKLYTEMTDDEIIQTVKAKGYPPYQEYIEKGYIVFGVPEKVLGTQPTALEIRRNEYNRIELGYGYCSPEYTVWTFPDNYPIYENLKEIYDSVSQQAEKVLGTPSLIDGRKTIWNTPDYIYKLEYISDMGLFVFSQELLIPKDA